MTSIDTMRPGIALDKMTTKIVLGKSATTHWIVCSPNGKAVAYTTRTQQDAENWLEDIRAKIPQSRLAQYRVQRLDIYPRYSTGVAPAWTVLEAIKGHGYNVIVKAMVDDRTMVRAEHSQSQRPSWSAVADSFPEAMCKVAIMCVKWDQATAGAEATVASAV